MALDDGAVQIAGQGFIYAAPFGTPKPVNLTDPEAPWTNIGHTSVDDNLVITRDGGDSNTKGTWQNPSLRVQRDPVSFALIMNLLQVSNETLSYYFGGGNMSVAGVFGAPINAVPQTVALFVRVVDGSSEFPFYIPKASLASDDDVEFDIEDFTHFPVRASILGVSGSNLMEFYGGHLGLQTNEVQTVTITGTPTGGTFTLTYAGQTTAPIAYNATATAVQTALRALSNLGNADVTCAGGPFPGTPVTATFGGDLADTDVAQMTASGSFTGGTSPTITVTTTTPGNP